MTFLKGHLQFNTGKTYWKKGRTPWNKGIKTGLVPKSAFKKGCVSLMTGKHHTKATREKIKERMTLEIREKLSENKRGSRNPFWKGGITPINKQIRQSFEYKLWRKSVYKRDNWTCQKCLINNHTLRPHHINNFSDYPKLRFVVDNGITFCNICHIKFHKTFGMEQNTLEQLKEYLSC